MLEFIFNNPGLQHIAENIFCNLNHEDLEVCTTINQSCKKILDEPMFWLKKFIRRGLSMKDQLDWTKAIQLIKHTNLEKNVLLYLKKSSKNKRVVNLPCYINEKVVMNSKKLIKKYRKPFNSRNFEKLFHACDDGDEGIIQLLAPFMKYPNPPDKDGVTPIHIAAADANDFVPIVQILAPLANNLNACDKKGHTAIFYAVQNGGVEIIRILAVLTDNPNEPQEYMSYTGMTPIHSAAAMGAVEIVKFLAPLSNNLNVTDCMGWSAMHAAAVNGRIEIIKFLAPLIDEPNIKDVYGNNPIDLATKNGHNDVVKFLESYKKPAKRARLK